jgi:DNA polymerase-3 subunit gamma/tau
MNLYNKHRPKTFTDMVGDFSHIEKSLKKPNHSHVYLLTGNAGCGKTTTARIMADMVGSDELSIEEYNMSDKTSVEDIRDLIDRGAYVPIGIRTVILDEVHKISASGFSAMLKMLEEVPNHTYYILCTSEIQKIPKAVRTRSTEIVFPPISVENLFTLVKTVAKKENIDIKADVANKIAEASNGSARKALVLLEEIIDISIEKRIDYLEQKGYIDEDSKDIMPLCRAIYGNNKPTVLLELKKLKDMEVDSETIRRVLLGYGTSVVLKSGNGVRQLSCFVENTYDSGFGGLVVMCMKAIGG